jgi:hypothetical protein
MKKDLRKAFIAIVAAATLTPGCLHAKELTPTGKGNSECFGDNSRQDVSCRALTENFLLSMRNATKPEVVRAMGVEGREVDDAGLHFISNYSKGERWGSGVVNFKFNPEGRATVIFATLDSPTVELENGEVEEIVHAQFIWNAELEPAGCSDLPNTRMKHCRYD